ncbi:MAG: LamG-like jellyroll fold domain-containing protein [Syntrophobacteraceae bacterium]
MAIGPDGKVHYTIEAHYYSSSFGGYGDFDIFYRRLTRAAGQVFTSDGAFWVTPPADSNWGFVPDGSWSHLAFTYDAGGGAGNLKLYMNGRLIGTTTATDSIATTDGVFFLGYYGIWDVAELRLWNRALSQAEILANASSRGLTGTEDGLNAYYTFKNTTRDITGKGNDGILMYKENYIECVLPTTDITPVIQLLLLD